MCLNFGSNNMSKKDSYIIETLEKNGVAIPVSIVAQVNM